jgi:hypothetical protein
MNNSKMSNSKTLIVPRVASTAKSTNFTNFAHPGSIKKVYIIFNRDAEFSAAEKKMATDQIIEIRKNESVLTKPTMLEHS